MLYQSGQRVDYSSSDKEETRNHHTESEANAVANRRLTPDEAVSVDDLCTTIDVASTHPCSCGEKE